MDSRGQQTGEQLCAGLVVQEDVAGEERCRQLEGDQMRRKGEQPREQGGEEVSLLLLAPDREVVEEGVHLNVVVVGEVRVGQNDVVHQRGGATAGVGVAQTVANKFKKRGRIRICKGIIIIIIISHT